MTTPSRGARTFAEVPLGLVVALLAYVILRAAILWTAFDQVAMPQYELYPMGTLARTILEPGGVPLARYYDNAGGQLVTGALAVPFYLAFGPTYLALKLVPAGLGLAALATLFFFLRRHFGETTATLGALLFALGPTTLTKYSLLASGNHFENIFFTLFTFFAFYRAHTSPRPERWLAITGFAAGFAIFVFLGAITPIALLCLVHLGLRGWRRTGRDLAFLVPGFAAGIAPLVALNLQARGRGLGFLDAKFSGSVRGFDPQLFADRLHAFLVEHLPAAATYPSVPGVSGRIAGVLFLGCFVFAYLCSLPEALRGMLDLACGIAGRDAATAASIGGAEPGAVRRAILVPLVLYLPLTAIAFGASNLAIGGYGAPMECGNYRYFLPHFTFAILLVAIAAGRLLNADALAARAAGLTLAGLALTTGVFNLALIDSGARERNLGARYDGSNFRQLARALVTQTGEAPNTEVVRGVEELPPVLRGRVYEGLGYYGAYIQSLAAGAGPMDLAALLAPYPRERHDDLARGFGMFLRQPRMQRHARQWFDTSRTPGEEGFDLVVEGLATEFGVVLSADLPYHLATDRRALAELTPALQPSFARGLGLLCGRILRRGIHREEEQVAETATALREDLIEPFFSGLGAGLADGADQPGMPPAALRITPESARAVLAEGFAGRVRAISAATR